MASGPTIEEIQSTFKDIQNKICQFLVIETGQPYLQDEWDFQKGTGGGISRVWEGSSSHSALEKGGVNYSGIVGNNLPAAAATQLKAPQNVPYHATGVSLVIHPVNPNIPTIHMNIRYFQAGDVWWFGGGIDLTPYYPKFDEVANFHKKLQELCEKHKQSYSDFKKECDEYFFLKHRDEMRGIGGIFFDHLTTGEKYSQSKEELWNFVKGLGYLFPELYRPFLTKEKQVLPYNKEMREYQLIRRGRYVEFNLVYDRGTKFGLQSEGRTESILMSLPTIAHWKYNWRPKIGSREEFVNNFYLKPQDWVTIKPTEKILLFENTPIIEDAKPINKKILYGASSVSAVVAVAIAAFVYYKSK